jgi:hypothetical protein
MADIFRKTLKRREAAADADVGTQVAAAPAPAPKPAVDFFKPQPTDPAAEAAKQKKLVEMLRNR